MKRSNRAHFYRPRAVIALQKKFKDMIALGKPVKFVTRVRSMGNYRSEHILVLERGDIGCCHRHPDK
jgi:hypothetical protein